jgi:hypothetical protein
MSRMRWAEAANDTLRALVRAAIAVRLGGETELLHYMEPTTGKPFQYSKTPLGFRLGSSKQFNGQSMTFSVEWLQSSSN